MARHIARWDLDKTYLRTEFDTFRDLVRTALERPDEKRTNPGAATLLREMVRSGISVHILSGSPEQMRRRLEDKLRLDGIKWDSFTLKPNLTNLLKLRFRAMRDQLGYKLPALLDARTRATPPAPDDPQIRHETLFGDDAEADAYVYSLYADVVAGRVDDETLLKICSRGNMYEDVIESVTQSLSRMTREDAVERILIHLERQTPPDDFAAYGKRAVPFYNYFQAALVVQEDGRIPAEAVLRVAVELVVQHRFDGDALGRSYLDLARRGHLKGSGADALIEALEDWSHHDAVPGLPELRRMADVLPDHAQKAKETFDGSKPATPDYFHLLEKHNPRKR